MIMPNERLSNGRVRPKDPGPRGLVPLPMGPLRWTELKNLVANDLLNMIEQVPPACLVYYVEHLDLPVAVAEACRQELRWQHETISAWLECEKRRPPHGTAA